MSNKVIVACTCDNNYSQHCAVMLESLFYNRSKQTIIDVYLFNNKLSDTNKHRIKTIAKKYLQNLKFINIKPPSIIDNIKIHEKHISVNAYYKVLIPKMIDQKVKRVLILDSDIVVKKDLYKLYSTKLHRNIIGATEDPYFDRFKELGIPKKYGYFNSGVLLVDIKKWNKQNISNKVINYAVNNNIIIKNAEQDPLNKILYQKRQSISFIYNQQTILHAYKNNKLKVSKREYQNAINDPAIIHFTSSSKPWQLASNHPQKDQYWKYLVQTPYTQKHYSNYSLKSAILHCLKIETMYKISDFLKVLRRYISNINLNNSIKT